MDLKEYYLKNITEQDYYYRFHDLIEHSDELWNVFEGYIKSDNGDNFIIYDIDDAIEKFKGLCQPENESHNKEESCWFYLLLFYLRQAGFVIKEFPRLIEHPPAETYDFVNKEIRNKIIALGKDDNGTVRYAERRKLVANLTFEQKENYVEIDDAIERKFRDISNRSVSFNNMSTDEKLAEIANLIENMLKKNGNFVALDYSSVCFDYFDDSTVKKYRKQIQCFRHSADDSVAERKTYSDEQKCFMIDFGLTMIKVIHELTT